MQQTQKSSPDKQSIVVGGSNLKTVDISRLFRTHIEHLWRAFESDYLIKQWWGPEGYTCPDGEMDFREGGQYRLAMKGPDQKVIWSGGKITQIIPNQKIVWTDQFMDHQGKVINAKDLGMKGDWPMTCIATLDFEALSDGESMLHIVHEGIPKEEHDNCVEGWNSSLNKLQKLVEGT